MGVKAKLEQELRRALREGRTEDAEVLKQNIADLKKARGDAAYERALSKKTYTIKSGDSPFSVAGKLYGDDRYAVDLLHANPGVYTFQPGMVIHAPDFNGPAPSLSEEQFAQLQDWGQPGGEDLSLPGYETPDLGPAPEANSAPEGGTPETAQPPAAEAAAAPEPAMTPEYEAQLNQTADAVVALMQKLGLLEGPGTQAGLEAQPATAPGGSRVQARPAAQGDGGEEPMPILTSEIQRVERERREAEESGDAERAKNLKTRLYTYENLRNDRGSRPNNNEPIGFDSTQRLQIDGPVQTDLTEWLSNEMVVTVNSEAIGEIKQILEEQAFHQEIPIQPGEKSELSDFLFNLFTALGKTYQLFGPQAPKNIKETINNRIGQAVVLCGEDSCRWVDYSTPGNILFGYSMAAAGIPKEIYWLAGGLLQVVDDAFGTNKPIPLADRIRSWGDNPADKAAVDFGASLYEQFGNGLTPEIFKESLTPEILETFEAPTDSTQISEDPVPQENQYSLGEFDYKPGK